MAETGFIDELKNIHKEIKIRSDERLAVFKRFRDSGTERELFIELAFCLLTPQSGARRCWSAIETLIEKKMLFSAPPEKISDELNIVRFKNNKARYIAEARAKFITDDGDNPNAGKISLRELLDNGLSAPEKREWLVKNVKGYGLKEASHFLRNVGFGDEIAILDRHILRNMARLGLMEKIPDSVTAKKYIELEKSLAEFSEKINIPMKYLDFVLWYRETGDLFK